MATVAVLGTCDTKLDELLFLKEQVQSTKDVKAILIDVGRKSANHDAVDFSSADLLSKYGSGQDTSQLARGEVIKVMAQCAKALVSDLFAKGEIDGIISAGGSGGTSLAGIVMRDGLPIGFPKMIVSTVASGDTGPIVGETDITLMYSVVDVAGLNEVLRDILSNAGSAIAGAALSFAKRRSSKADDGGASSQPPKKKRVGITMFGVTTPGVDAIREHLEAHYPVEAFVFHATGHGGKAMERLIRSGRLDAVIDLTTTEICDLLMGGVMAAEDTRLDAAVQAEIPNIVSVGATDMANFGAKSTVPSHYGDRRQVEHNPLVTLVRSSVDDNKKIGEFISSKLRKTKRPDLTQVWIPKGGVSMLATPGGPFFDKDADDSLFNAIKDGLQGSGIEVIEDERDVNDKGLAVEIAESLATKLSLIKLT